ncbi:hypothetical protein [Mycolicibacterium sp. HS_4_1]
MESRHLAAPQGPRIELRGQVDVAIHVGRDRQEMTQDNARAGTGAASLITGHLDVCARQANQEGTCGNDDSSLHDSLAT